MAWPTLLDCRLRELRRNHCATGGRVLLALGELRQTNIDLGLVGSVRIVANAADPFDTPEQIVIRERINCVNSLAHWQIITESESIKEPRGRSRSQSYSQIALLHSHLFLHDQLTFADISGTDIKRRQPLRVRSIVSFDSYLVEEGSAVQGLQLGMSGG